MHIETTALPSRTEPFGGIGWTVYSFDDSESAARFFLANPQAEMPCWKRFRVIDGKLIQVC